MSLDRTNPQRMPDDALLSTDDAVHTVQPGRISNSDPLDQTLVRVDQATWDFFISVLDQPPDNPGFSKLMQAPAPWNY